MTSLRAIGIDIGATHTYVCALDEHTHHESRFVFDTQDTAGRHDAGPGHIAAVLSRAKELLSKESDARIDLVGIALAPSTVQHQHDVVFQTARSVLFGEHEGPASDRLHLFPKPDAAARATRILTPVEVDGTVLTAPSDSGSGIGPEWIVARGAALLAFDARMVSVFSTIVSVNTTTYFDTLAYETIERIDLGADSSFPDRLGPFLIQRRLGQGAFTGVFLATDSTSLINRTVALKIPFPQPGFGVPAVARVTRDVNVRSPGVDAGPALPLAALFSPLTLLLKEAAAWRALSQRSHPNIIHFEDLKAIDDVWFFVMEYMDGGNLIEALDGLEGESRVAAIVQTLEQICEGLAFAHSVGVLHGDLKPQNILASKGREKIKLGDFGLSILREDGDVSGKRLIGSPMFLAPECFDGINTAASDIYSLGVTLYYLLTQEYPFPHFETNLQDLKEAKNSFHPNLRAKRPEIPIWLEEIVRRCMAPKPQERFHDGRDVLERVRLKHAVLSVKWDYESGTVDYDLDLQTHRSLEMLPKTLPHGAIAGLSQSWNKLGELALQRARSTLDEISRFDRAIRDQLDAIAEEGADFVLGAKLREMLSDERVADLWLLHDPRLAVLPWELFKIGATCACRRLPISRWPRLRQKPSPARLGVAQGERIRVLIVANPSGDLPGTVHEAETVTAAFKESAAPDEFDIEVTGPDLDEFELLRKIRHCHVLHYAGHALFEDRGGDSSRSGWLLAADDDSQPASVLRASTLEDVWKGAGPLLVFANGCESARVSSRALRKQVDSDAALGLAQGFLAAGASNYIGTVWNAPDSGATTQFATAFYRELLSGATIGQSLYHARLDSAARFGEENLTWARYVHCGDPFARLRDRPRRR